MPAKDFNISKAANKQANKLPEKIHDKIDEAFDKLQQNPLIGEKLHGELKGYFKYRIGDYRIVYSFDPEESILYISKIEHRQGVYK